MRIWNLSLATFVLAVVLAMLRDEVGRVAVIVFLAGLGLMASGLMAIMALFQTLGAFGEARGVVAHVEALAASAVVLLVGSAAMLAAIYAGAWLVNLAVP